MQIIIWDEHLGQPSAFLREHVPVTRPEPSPPARLRPSPLPPHTAPPPQGPHFSPSSFLCPQSGPGTSPIPSGHGDTREEPHIPGTSLSLRGGGWEEQQRSGTSRDVKQRKKGDRRELSDGNRSPTSIPQPRGSRGRENVGGEGAPAQRCSGRTLRALTRSPRAGGGRGPTLRVGYSCTFRVIES